MPILQNIPLGLLQGTEIPLWIQETESWSNILQSIITALGIIVGGFFAYFKFFKTREFAERIEPRLSAGRVVRKDGHIYIECQADAKNVGKSRVALNQQYTAIVAERLDAATMEWTPVGK